MFSTLLGRFRRFLNRVIPEYIVTLFHFPLQSVDRFLKVRKYGWWGGGGGVHTPIEIVKSSPKKAAFPVYQDFHGRVEDVCTAPETMHLCCMALEMMTTSKRVVKFGEGV